MISALRAFLLLLPVLAQVEFVLACDEGWYLNPETGMCYMMSDKRLSWVEAAVACAEMGARLAVINNESDDSFVRALASILQVNTEVWIGAQAVDQVSHDFVWMGGEMVGPYTDWASNEPNNAHGGEHCVDLFYAYNNEYKWNDSQCFLNYRFVCQKPEIGCNEDFDCMDGNHLPCSVCQDNSCTNPECCTDDDCASNEYCTDAHECVIGCNENSDCMDGNHLPCSVCESNSCTNPECCVDDDCNSDQYCDNNTCVDGCNEDSDCNADMSCAECGADHQCTTPICCAISDCTANHLPCTECQADNTCTDPECCENQDCPSNMPICDNHVCVAGCIDNPDCPMYDGICIDEYTEEDASCFYCDKDDDDKYGDCEPGCINDENCATGLVCNGQHRCVKPGSLTALQSIQIDTASCSGCSGSNVEGGAILFLKGKDGANNYRPNCTTDGLDHVNQIDYTAGGSAIFDVENDSSLLGGCYLVNLLAEVKSGSITWTGQGKITIEKVTFCWSDSLAICSVCQVSGPVAQDQTLPMTCSTL